MSEELTLIRTPKKMPNIDAFESVEAMVKFLNELWLEIAQEWNQEEYSGRTHGFVSTYTAGCRGPVCRLGVRVERRENRKSEPTGAYVWLDPIIVDYNQRLHELDQHNQAIVQDLRAAGALLDPHSVNKIDYPTLKVNERGSLIRA